HENILVGVVQGVAHVQLAGDVGRRDDHAERFLAFVHLSVEKAVFLPVRVPFLFHFFWIVSLLHSRSLPKIISVKRPFAHLRTKSLSRGTTLVLPGRTREALVGGDNGTTVLSY